MTPTPASASPAPRADVRTALRACRLWHGASDESVALLAGAVDVVDVPRGTLLASEGDAADRFGVVVAGRVRVLSLGADGKRVTLEDIDSGQPFGAVAVLANGRYPAAVETVTPATIAWVGRDAVNEMIAREPAVAQSLISDLAMRVLHFTGVVQTLTLEVPERVARYLFQRALAAGSPAPDGLHVDLGMSKTELAQAIGTVPETLSRALSRLKADGVLDVRGRTVVVFDVGALARMGAGVAEE